MKKIYYILMKLGHIICHQKPERSFFIKGWQFPVCARCTGIIISFFIAIILLVNKIKINFATSIILVLVMFLDWLIQYLKIKESSNCRRFLTGLIGGFGLSFFYYNIILFIK